MIITQLHMTKDGDWLKCSRAKLESDKVLALVFWSDTDQAKVRSAVHALKEKCAGAEVVGCSTGGVIQDRLLFEKTVSATLVTFESSNFRIVSVKGGERPDGRTMGQTLGAALPHEGLVHVFALADGLTVNGCALAAGLAESLPQGVGITGGLAGDGERFESTQLLCGTDIFSRGALCVGFYGDKLHIGQGTHGGWIPFGPERLITASDGNVLFELDGESALDLYIRYLGKHAENLPASGHLFPMHLREPGRSDWVVRTILGVDRTRKALSFGGDVPLGSTVRLMRGNIDNLLDGAEAAGQDARLDDGKGLAIVVSCVGRKMLLQQFAEEEIDMVAQALGSRTMLTGFYSYGELACGENGETCCLHNQTMAVTHIQERE